MNFIISDLHYIFHLFSFIFFIVTETKNTYKWQTVLLNEKNFGKFFQACFLIKLNCFVFRFGGVAEKSLLSNSKPMTFSRRRSAFLMLRSFRRKGPHRLTSAFLFLLTCLYCRKTKQTKSEEKSCLYLVGFSQVSRLDRENF